jgi:hypothetical protein
MTSSNNLGIPIIELWIGPKNINIEEMGDGMGLILIYMYHLSFFINGMESDVTDLT